MLKYSLIKILPMIDAADRQPVAKKESKPPVAKLKMADTPSRTPNTISHVCAALQLARFICPFPMFWYKDWAKRCMVRFPYIFNNMPIIANAIIPADSSNEKKAVEEKRDSL